MLEIPTAALVQYLKVYREVSSDNAELRQRRMDAVVEMASKNIPIPEPNLSYSPRETANEYTTRLEATLATYQEGF